MDILVEPLETNDIDDFTAIYWAAFNPVQANMILPMIYPLGLQPDLKERLRNRVLKSMNTDPNSHCFCARDATSGQIVGVSWWSKTDDSPRTKEDLDQRYQEVKDKRSGGVDVAGMNGTLEKAFFKAAFYSEAETMGSKPYVTLKLLAVRPDYARKGVGTLLLRQGLKDVDRLDLPAFIHAGVQAKPLYARHGFETLREMPCNALHYGGRSDGIHWCMVRPPRSEVLNADES